MEENEFNLVSASKDIGIHRVKLDEAGINYSISQIRFYGECLRIKINTIQDLLEIIYAVEEELIFIGDSLIEIYDSYRE